MYLPFIDLYNIFEYNIDIIYKRLKPHWYCLNYSMSISPEMLLFKFIFETEWFSSVNNWHKWVLMFYYLTMEYVINMMFQHRSLYIYNIKASYGNDGIFSILFSFTFLWLFEFLMFFEVCLLLQIFILIFIEINIEFQWYFYRKNIWDVSIYK